MLDEIASNSVVVITSMVMTMISIVGLYNLLKRRSRGIIPAFYKLALSLSEKQIVVVADADKSPSIEDALENTDIILPHNVTALKLGDLGRLDAYHVVVLQYDYLKDRLDDAFNYRNSQSVVVIYAPPRSITDEHMEIIEREHNCLVTNHRGRLIVDVISALGVARMHS